MTVFSGKWMLMAMFSSTSSVVARGRSALEQQRAARARGNVNDDVNARMRLSEAVRDLKRGATSRKRSEFFAWDPNMDMKEVKDALECVNSALRGASSEGDVFQKWEKMTEAMKTMETAVKDDANEQKKTAEETQQKMKKALQGLPPGQDALTVSENENETNEAVNEVCEMWKAVSRQAVGSKTSSDKVVNKANMVKEVTKAIAAATIVVNLERFKQLEDAVKRFEIQWSELRTLTKERLQTRFVQRCHETHPDKEGGSIEAQKQTGADMQRLTQHLKFDKGDSTAKGAAKSHASQVEVDARGEAQAQATSAPPKRAAPGGLSVKQCKVGDWVMLQGISVRSDLNGQCGYITELVDIKKLMDEGTPGNGAEQRYIVCVAGERKMVKAENMTSNDESERAARAAFFSKHPPLDRSQPAASSSPSSRSPSGASRPAEVGASRLATPPAATSPSDVVQPVAAPTLPDRNNNGSGVSSASANSGRLCRGAMSHRHKGAHTTFSSRPASAPQSRPLTDPRNQKRAAAAVPSRHISNGAATRAATQIANRLQKDVDQAKGVGVSNLNRALPRNGQQHPYTPARVSGIRDLEAQMKCADKVGTARESKETEIPQVRGRFPPPNCRRPREGMQAFKQTPWKP